VKDIVLKNTFQIDENLVYDELAMMKVGRYCSAITLLKDQYIVAAGGNIGKSKYTNSVEIFDSHLNQWVTLNSMQRPRGNTSIV